MSATLFCCHLTAAITPTFGGQCICAPKVSFVRILYYNIQLFRKYSPYLSQLFLLFYNGLNFRQLWFLHFGEKKTTMFFCDLRVETSPVFHSIGPQMAHLAEPQRVDANTRKEIMIAKQQTTML